MLIQHIKPMTTRWHKSPQLNERLGFVSTFNFSPKFFFIVVLELVKRFEYKLRRLVTLATNLRKAQGG